MASTFQPFSISYISWAVYASAVRLRRSFKCICRYSNIIMSGPVTITDNTAQIGGAIWTEAPKLTITGDADISRNTATVAVRFRLLCNQKTLRSVLFCPLQRKYEEETPSYCRFVSRSINDNETHCLMQPLSTARNHWATLSAFGNWAAREIIRTTKHFSG